MSLDNSKPKRNLVISASYRNFNDGERLTNILADEFEELSYLRIKPIPYQTGIKAVIDFGYARPEFGRLEVDGHTPYVIYVDFVGKYDYVRN